IQQHRLHGRRARAEELGEPAERRQVVERVEAEQADRRLRPRIVTQAHSAEPPGIAEHDFTAVVESEVQLEKARRPLVLVRAPAERMSRRRAASTSGSSGIGLVYMTAPGAGLRRPTAARDTLRP